MPLIPFWDKELEQQLTLLKNRSKKTTELEEHYFIAMCLQNGFSLEDLREMEYVDIVKIMICLIPEEHKYTEATEEDWDNLI